VKDYQETMGSANARKKQVEQDLIQLKESQAKAGGGKCKPDPSYDGKRFCRQNPNARSHQECVERCQR